MSNITSKAMDTSAQSNAQMMIAQDEDVVARPHRPRVLKGGTILDGPNNSEVPCMIRNMHEKGAELSVDPDAALPKHFLLYVRTDGTAYRAELRWRNGKRAGVSFHGTEPKPAWHYG